MTPAFILLFVPAAPVLKPCPKSGQIHLESPRLGRDSALPRRRAHSASQRCIRDVLSLLFQEFLHPLPFCCQFQLC